MEQQHGCVVQLELGSNTDDFGWAFSYLSQSEFVPCPYTECAFISLIKKQILDHIEEFHDYHPCQDCRSGKFVIGDRHHLEEAHACDFCHECEKPVSSINIGYHRSASHGWWKCPYCDRADKDSEELATHIKEDHHVKQCHVCQSKFLATELMPHLLQDHKYHKCAFCQNSDTFDKEKLAEHILDFHTKPCPVCKELQPSEDMVSTHLRASHGWENCEYCNMPQNPILFDLHIKSHQLRQCQICSQQIPTNGWENHKSRTHGLIKSTK